LLPVHYDVVVARLILDNDRTTPAKHEIRIGELSSVIILLLVHRESFIGFSLSESLAFGGQHQRCRNDPVK
jgi:hypothetical protein